MLSTRKKRNDFPLEEVYKIVIFVSTLNSLYKMKNGMMRREDKRIVVLGGSFNPPTSAHYKLIKRAVDELNADVGFFVPVSEVAH